MGVVGGLGGVWWSRVGWFRASAPRSFLCVSEGEDVGLQGSFQGLGGFWGLGLRA